MMLNAPKIQSRYWIVLCFASVLGANLGDVMSRELGLGYSRGLPVLAAVFAAVVFTARFARGGTAWYWLAIVTVRGAATNLADWQALTGEQTPTLRFAAVFPVIIFVWVVLLASLALRDSRRARDRTSTDTDIWFWAAMLAAGTLGTAIGDWLAFISGLGLVGATVLTSAILVLALVALTTRARGQAVAFWILVLAIRTWGTNMGDLLADRVGLWLSFGLAVAGTAAVVAIFNDRLRNR
jgi:uncharacterized membrane-anchored protein